jgi:hypothetical protein
MTGRAATGVKKILTALDQIVLPKNVYGRQ